MMRLFAAAILFVFMSSAALAAEITATLAVQNMACDFCIAAVKRSLEAVPGVTRAIVSLNDKTAVVTYDDAKSDVKGLIDATTKAGYPSVPKD